MGICNYCMRPLAWAVLIVYGLLFVGIAFAAFKWAKKPLYRGLIILGGFGLLLIIPIANRIQYNNYKKEQQNTLAQAMRVFNERCKGAGEKIYKTVDNVEGVLLLKVRERGGPGENAMQVDAAVYLVEASDDYYIYNFLRYEADENNYDFYKTRHLLHDKKTSKPGYRFVDAIDPKDGKRYRYTLGGKTGFELEKKETIEPPPPYAITYEDLVDPADRKYWVAGTHIKVIDTRNNEVLGEYLRYVISKGQGKGDTPWGFVKVCTEQEKKDYPIAQGVLSRFFVNKVLYPEKK